MRLYSTTTRQFDDPPLSPISTAVYELQRRCGCFHVFCLWGLLSLTLHGVGTQIWFLRRGHGALYATPRRRPKIRAQRLNKRTWEGCCRRGLETTGRCESSRPRFQGQIPAATLTHSFPGLWGLAGYPLTGLHRRLRDSLATDHQSCIVASRIDQGIEELHASSPEERAEVVRKWHTLHQLPGSMPSIVSARREQ